MLQKDTEKGDDSYYWLDITNPENIDEIYTFTQTTTSQAQNPDVDYVDNYYTDDLEKKPTMICQRRTVIAIYSVITLMFIYKYLTLAHNTI